MGDRLSRVTGELSSFKQRERERAIQAYVDVETMSLMKIINWQRGNQK